MWLLKLTSWDSTSVISRIKLFLCLGFSIQGNSHSEWSLAFRQWSLTALAHRRTFVMCDNIRVVIFSYYLLPFGDSFSDFIQLYLEELFIPDISRSPQTHRPQSQALYDSCLPTWYKKEDRARTFHQNLSHFPDCGSQHLAFWIHQKVVITDEFLHSHNTKNFTPCERTSAP